MSIPEKKIPTISVHYYVNGEKVSKRTYDLCKQSLQTMLFEPYQETKQRIPISRYSIHTIFELTY